MWLTPGMGRRGRAVLSVPLLVMSVIAIFTFFGGTEVGYIFVYRLLYEGESVMYARIYMRCCRCFRTSPQSKLSQQFDSAIATGNCNTGLYNEHGLLRDISLLNDVKTCV